MQLGIDESAAMTEHVQDREAPRPEGPVTTADEHWQGYPGEGEAQSYVVPAGARYGALFALLILALMMAAMAFMTMHEW
ncbi:MAG: hypothetical protein BGO98_07035 [Myxococcales bacterium 68-20]|nr:MAG: hypothetical protein BGO98_07035 [Myxococcales bacterium 68-20]